MTDEIIIIPKQSKESCLHPAQTRGGGDMKHETLYSLSIRILIYTCTDSYTYPAGCNFGLPL